MINVAEVCKESVKRLLETELDLCGKLLDVDERNFHCWNHRMHVMGLMRTRQKEQTDPIDLSSIDLELSTELINRNFSNYSAWHLRALLQQRAGTEEGHLGSTYVLNQLLLFSPRLPCHGSMEPLSCARSHNYRLISTRSLSGSRKASSLSPMTSLCGSTTTG